MFDLDAFLKRVGLNQKEFGEVVGVGSSAISKLKRGEMKMPAEWRPVIVDKLGVDPFDFMLPDPGPVPFKNSLNKLFPAPNQKAPEVNQIPATDFMEVQFLPIVAQAGYLDALESQTNPELDTMLIPTEFEKGNYLVVEVSGDSMNDGTARAILDGDRLLVKELQLHHWKSKLHFKQYLFVIASTEGIVCKQITEHDVEAGVLTCHSWNVLYQDYQIHLGNVYKLFYVKKIVERRIKF